MPLWGELLVAAVIFVGLIGIVVPILPGTLLIAGALLVWAIVVGGWAWSVFAAAMLALVVGEVIKYLVAGKSLRTDGIPNRTVVVGGLVGIVGFFVVPVIGLLLGFVVGAVAAELVRTQSLELAWRGAVAALKAAAKTIGIELLFALVATSIWTGGAFVW
ncbi:DUF456 domain-containing protein [Gordonia rubripertincta]|uniref:DUF456 domain-containing protein n=2 Tax=Gordonia rubripertincta TaxID=36822 RepID=A0AAW4FZZ0_GORRU|nr:DUF456 domain-containing protein [Gordonia rubripertincta]ASR04825.1 hypothetical protein GCWB2_20265 [Gordonia rubripertincta]MBM7276756.1 DUF456 domain-containing protein [Gordonia rubripertincta]MDG6781729.1 DUF456 domain-containing protein [Gordonia rubripertincta]NKY65464.1 DUF456 domain-containing protein [Gordonia rubripertincta]QMU21202.1 DUF456 domain-containing protein [Gordonia rubripertincta]